MPLIVGGFPARSFRKIRSRKIYNIAVLERRGALEEVCRVIGKHGISKGGTGTVRVRLGAAAGDFEASYYDSPRNRLLCRTSHGASGGENSCT